MRLRALHFHDVVRWGELRHPGSFILAGLGEPGLFRMQLISPLGGEHFVLRIGHGFRPAGDRPSWRWNGSLTEPTLDPSVQFPGHWHGRLRLGYWEPGE